MTQITSVADYISTIINSKQKFEPEHKIWFRGHGSTEYNLWPNLYREMLSRDTTLRPNIDEYDIIRSVEMNIDALFSIKAFSYFSKRGIPATPWYRYFLKQHYKLRTRLLDWTESALVALFFALEDKSKLAQETDAIVYMLAPGKLNNYSINHLLKTDPKKPFHIIPTPNELPEKGDLYTKESLLNVNQLLRKYYRLNCDKDENMYPLAIRPPHLDERMSAQQACFTIFGNVVDGLANNSGENSFLDYVCIKVESKTKILKELQILGINHYSIYPDLDGLGHSINEEVYPSFDNAKLWDNLGNYS